MKLNLTASVYNVPVNLNTGTYTYGWHSWGNGGLKLYNKSADRSYTVNASLETCTFTGLKLYLGSNAVIAIG